MNRTFVNACRTLHIYLTMLGLFVMLGFGITGFTVNHEEWFGATRPRVVDLQGETPTSLIERGDALHIVEHLRQTFHISGAMTGYDDLDDRLSVGFKSPGESWEAEIEKATGKTALHHEAFNLMAVINNLHRGRYAGAAWSWIIDVSAFLIFVASATGFVLWLTLPRRRQIGIAALLVGTAATVAVFAMLVPGRDIKPESKPAPAAGADTLH